MASWDRAHPQHAAADPKLEEGVDTPENCTASKRDLKRLQKWANLGGS